MKTLYQKPTCEVVNIVLESFITGSPDVNNQLSNEDELSRGFSDWDE